MGKERFKNPSGEGLGGERFTFEPRRPSFEVFVEEMKKEARRGTGQLSLAAVERAADATAEWFYRPDRLMAEFHELRAEHRNVVQEWNRLRSKAIGAVDVIRRSHIFGGPSQEERERAQTALREEIRPQLRKADREIAQIRDRMEEIAETLYTDYHAVRILDRGPELRLPEDDRDRNETVPVSVATGSGGQ